MRKKGQRRGQEGRNGLNGRSGWQCPQELRTLGEENRHPRARTYMLLCDAADVPDVHDLSLVPHHAHCDGVLTHLGGNVAVHLDAQVLQHQEPCASQQRESKHCHQSHQPHTWS